MPNQLLRSLLFVPADSPRKIEKAKSLRPDAFIFDLEDAVAVDKKAAAREGLARELRNLSNPAGKVFVRLNAIPTQFFAGDLRMAVDPAVDAILLPKCDDETEVALVDKEISRLEDQKNIAPGKIKLLPILETARGVVRAFEIACGSRRVMGLAFGAEDYAADMGMKRTPSGEEVSVPRLLVSQAAHAARAAAIDGVFTDFHDDAGLMADTRRAIAMGYTGKALIHPNQIEPVHRAFAPAEEDVAWAMEVVRTFEDAKAKGSGVVVVRGRMVDEPLVIQARWILQQRSVSAGEKESA
jgi:citrate lyase subunit beta/citryl-CoA lyase